MANIGNTSEQRVKRIMSRVKTSIALRDVLAFGLGRIWLVLLELFAVVYKLSNTTASKHSEEFLADTNAGR